MKGEFIDVWPEMWGDVWTKLARHRDAPNDIFCELFREIETKFKIRLNQNLVLADIVDSPEQSRSAFKRIRSSGLVGEASLVEFLVSSFELCIDISGQPLAFRFADLLRKFIEKFGLRYDVSSYKTGQQFSLTPSLSGIFQKLIHQLQSAAIADPHTAALQADYHEALRDLRLGLTEARLKTCMQKQVNLFEGIARAHPQTQRRTISSICNDINRNAVLEWPHPQMLQAVQELYGFSCDYPGIRHGGTIANQKRPIDVRDFIAFSMMLAGTAPYLAKSVDLNKVYLGGTP